MNKIIENTIEGYTINLFEKQSYKYFYAPSIAPDIEKVKIDLNKLKELDLLHRESSTRGHWELLRGNYQRNKMNITDNNKKEQLQKKITDSMMSAFETVIRKKNEWYSINKNTYTPKDVRQIISKCGNTNAIISGGAGLIPGAWGMLVVVPEISLIIKNQIEMIYDIGKANNKTGKELSKELIIGVFASSMGTAGIGLITIHAGKVLVKRATLRVLQKIVAMLGGKVTQRLLKSVVAKWLPGLGAAAMAAWSKFSTNIIGKETGCY